MTSPRTPSAIRVFVCAASLRADSLNQKLAALAARVAVRHRRDRRPGVDARVRRADLRRRFRGGARASPTAPRRFQRRLIASDAFIIASPEYNASMPGGLKNLIDWTSRFRPQPFDGRHGLLMSASPSLAGGNRGLWALRVPFEHLGTRVFPDMFSLSMAHKAFAGDDLADAGAAGALRQDRAGVPVAGRGGEALPVHEAGLGRVPGRAARPGSMVDAASTPRNEAAAVGSRPSQTQPASPRDVLEPVVADGGAALHAGAQHHVAHLLRRVDAVDGQPGLAALPRSAPPSPPTPRRGTARRSR